MQKVGMGTSIFRQTVLRQTFFSRSSGPIFFAAGRGSVPSFFPAASATVSGSTSPRTQSIMFPGV